MDDSELEPSRRALLEYYNSQTMTHGGYIIALVIGFLTLVSRWQDFAKPQLVWIFFLFMVSALVALGVYMVGRILLWGALAYEILNAKIPPPSKLSPEQFTLMLRLHEGALNKVRARRAGFFENFKKRTALALAIFLILWIILSILFPHC